jgi:hypothetical protein
MPIKNAIGEKMERDVCVRCQKKIVRDPDGFWSHSQTWVSPSVNRINRIVSQFCEGEDGLARRTALPAHGAVVTLGETSA